MYDIKPNEVTNQDNINNIEIESYPNPSSNSITFKFFIPENSKIRLSIINQMGTEVLQIIEANYLAGTNEIKYYSSSLPDGIYFYKFQFGNKIVVKKMIILR